jgi:hypothetical protein
MKNRGYAIITSILLEYINENAKIQEYDKNPDTNIKGHLQEG